MLWFEKLVGFKETNMITVKENIIYENGELYSKVNQKTYKTGSLTLPNLKELRTNLRKENSKIMIKNIFGNVSNIMEENEGATFQVASQFNLLEMIRPETTPEDGISIYQYDNTQGPISAIACGAGTIYRNYFINGQGQTKDNQIDCLKDIGNYLNNSNNRLWEMKNGYALATAKGLIEINDMIKKNREEIKSLLRIGIQSNVEVTRNNFKRCITQVFCSALPVSYSQIKSSKWKEFSKLILEATYEATFLAAIKNKKSNKLFLTLIGGGAFGNDISWILDAIKYNVIKYKDYELDINLINYNYSYRVESFIEELNEEIA